MVSNELIENAKGLLFIWADVEAGYLAEYQKWHNCEHIPERLQIPGFLVARRYRDIGRASGFLMFYETTSSRVMKSDAYLQAKNNPTPWTKETITHFSNNGRSIFGLVATEGQKPPIEAPYLVTIRFNPQTGSTKEIINWCHEEYLKNLCSIPGIYRGRLYENDTEVSGIVTTEQRISGSRPGEHNYVVLFEISSPALLESEPWQNANKALNDPATESPKLKDIREELYWLDFAMYAPEHHGMV